MVVAAATWCCRDRVDQADGSGCFGPDGRGVTFDAFRWNRVRRDPGGGHVRDGNDA